MRCFVALWPDHEARERLAEAAAALAREIPSARPTRADNLHLTLAFIGELRPALAAVVVQRLAALPRPWAPSTPWRLDRIGSFPSARVAWAGGEHDERLERLASDARSILDDLHVHYDRKPFAAHVTLARHVGRLEARGLEPPVRWPIGQPRLVVSARDDAGRTAYRNWRHPGDRVD
ncbi:MAG TPA: RNA 2',3'-cyclic phosphodiesterase [Burkholderiaceae bacterium]|nr:RNA 2',3'-cyclic phosphodiesterase [Burkholderiaceae bacterium]